MRIDRCSSPRPRTSNVSAESVSSTRSATFDSSSRISRSRIWRDVRYLPSRPANGDALTMKYIETVGSSTAVAAMPSGNAASAIVSPMLRPSIPDTQMMSPADASSTSMRSRPWKASIFVSRKPVVTAPSRATLTIGALTFDVPRKMRPMPIRPT